MDKVTKPQGACGSGRGGTFLHSDPTTQNPDSGMSTTYPVCIAGKVSPGYGSPTKGTQLNVPECMPPVLSLEGNSPKG